MPLKPCTGWSVNGGMMPLTGSVPSAAPDGSLAGSNGYEGLAISPDRRTLYGLLEGTVTGDEPGSLRLGEFDLVAGRYTGRRWTYQLDDPRWAIGDAIAVDRHSLLVIERDGGQGAEARFKKIYLVDQRDRDHDGRLDKTLVADLMNIADPRGFGSVFTFPFTTIEDVVILDDRTLGVLNDNNFPFSSGRDPGSPDGNEFITIRLTDRLHADPRVLRP